MEINSHAIFPADWKIKRIDEVCDRVTSGGTPSRSTPSYYENGIWPWVKTKELMDGWIDDTEEYITDEAIVNSSAKVLLPNTILLAMYGATVGQLGILRRQMTCNQACCALITNPKKADYRYLYYQLLYSREQLKNLATGAAQQNLSGELIKSLQFPFPSLVEQRAIAHILGTLDDKIELNRKMNKTLEAMAQALFKSWFVDFEPWGGVMPEDWEEISLSKLMDIAGGTQPPASEFINEIRDGYIRLIQIRDYETDAHLTYVPKTTKLRTTNKIDIMIARYGASVGRICWGLEGAYNVALVRVICDDTHREYLRTYLKSDIFQNQLAMLSARSAQSGFNKEDIASFKIWLPKDRTLLTKYQKIIWPLREKILHTQSNEVLLVKIRDLLLPKLISGQIRLKDAEKLLESCS